MSSAVESSESNQSTATRRARARQERQYGAPKERESLGDRRTRLLAELDALLATVDKTLDQRRTCVGTK